MAKVVQQFSNLIGGVSSQPATIRDPGQAEAQENAVSSIVEGLRKRPNSEWIAGLNSWPSVTGGDIKTHFINRDSTERYVVALGDQSQNGDSTIKVYDYADGSVNAIKDYAGNTAVGADFTYLDCLNPATDLKALTVADYTFIVNNQITPVMKADLTATRRFEALYVVNAGNYATDYSIKIQASGIDCKINFKTNDTNTVTNANNITTEYIAKALADNLTASVAVNHAADGALITLTGTRLVAADWDITIGEEYLTSGSTTGGGSVIHIQRSNTWVASNSEALADFDITATDGVGSTNTTAIKGTVQTFLELPKEGKNGFIVKIDGDPESVSGDYYAKFVTDSGDDFDSGIWQETIPSGIAYKIDETTMPHLLIRLSNGDFLFTPANGTSYSFGGVDTVEVPSWTDREVGDTISNPDPSFIGNPINDVFYFKDRLGFLADDATILSTAGSYFTFFRTTVIDLLDSARIDVRSSHTKVTKLYNAVPLGEQLITFSDRTQFSLRGENLLTPKTVAITPVSEHQSYGNVKPIAVGSSIFMAAQRGANSIVRELVDVSQNRPKFQLLDIMMALPAYISGDVLTIEASESEDMLAVLADGDKSVLYVYNFFINGNERVQSAWSKFTFGGDIIHVSFVDNSMVLVVKRDSEYDLEVLNMQPFAVDTGKTYKTLLDRRVSETQLTSAVYTSGTNSTVLTLPYTVPAGNEIRTVKSNGAVLTPTSTTSTTATFTGDYSATTLWVGEVYDMLYQFSPISLKVAGQTQGLRADSSGVYHLTWGHMVYEDSGYFQVEVTLTNQTASTYIMSGYTTGGIGAILGAMTLEDGTFDFGLLGPAKDITVKLKSDSHFPCRFVSAEFEGKYRSRGVRL